jgi:hypothetical protein
MPARAPQGARVASPGPGSRARRHRCSVASPQTRDPCDPRWRGLPRLAARGARVSCAFRADAPVGSRSRFISSPTATAAGPASEHGATSARVPCGHPGLARRMDAADGGHEPGAPDTAVPPRERWHEPALGAADGVRRGSGGGSWPDEVVAGAVETAPSAALVAPLLRCDAGVWRSAPWVWASGAPRSSHELRDPHRVTSL